MSGCATTPVRELTEPSPSPLQSQTKQPAVSVEKVKVSLQPSYKNLVEQLENRADKKGVKFYLTPEGYHVLFALKDTDTFFIADKTGTCLFQIGVTYEEQTAAQLTANDITITPGPCSLRYPDISEEAAKIVTTMAEDLVIPSLMDRLTGKPWFGECSEKNFLRQTLLQKMPYDINDNNSEPEGTIAQISTRIMNSLDIAFGDVVFFPFRKNQTAVGVYVGYGLVVYHKDCSAAAVHRLSGDIPYRIYRPIAGFSWTRYQIKDIEFLQNYIDQTK